MSERQLVAVQIPGRPPTINRERAEHWRKHRESTSVYRQAAYLDLLSLKARGVWTNHFPMVKVDVWSYYEKGRMPDVGACMPAVKAIIDGAVDAGLLVDDTPDIVRHLAFWAPRKDKFIGDQLAVIFNEVQEGDAWE